MNDGESVRFPVTVLLEVTPCAWEFKHSPVPIFHGTHASDAPLCFVATPAPLLRPDAKLKGPPKGQHQNAWKVRDAFIALKTQKEFLDFLNRFGQFGQLLGEDTMRGWQLSELLGCQKIIGGLLKRSPASWKEYADSQIKPDTASVAYSLSRTLDASSHNVEFQWHHKERAGWRGAPYRAVLRTNEVLSAILATVQIDHLRGAKFDICARQGCQKFYRIKSRHKRDYCSHACAHAEGTRRRRAKAKRKHLSKA